MEIVPASINNQFFILPTYKGFELIDSNRIIRVEAISNYSKLYFADGKTLVVAKVLKWFEENLSASQFIRVHRTHLVNKKFIRQYYKEGRANIRLLNGDSIEVSRRKRTFVLQSLYMIAA